MGIRVDNDDCMHMMKSMLDDSVDFILTDIPYELNLSGGDAGGTFTSNIYNARERSSLNFISQGIDYDAVFSEFIRVLRKVNACIFCSNRQIGKIMTWWENRGYTATLLVWEKPNVAPLGNGNYISNIEFIVYVREKGVTYNNLGYSMQKKTFHYPLPPPKIRIHETEKPIDLLRHLLMIHTKENDVVFDPYAGSFTTAIACYKEKRSFVGCEILEKYYKPALDRLKNIVTELTLF